MQAAQTFLNLKLTSEDQRRGFQNATSMHFGVMYAYNMTVRNVKQYENNYLFSRYLKALASPQGSERHVSNVKLTGKC